jgi:hypothetical protein
MGAPRSSRATNRAAAQRNRAALARQVRFGAPRRSRHALAEAGRSFAPPEDWHEPSEEPLDAYTIIQQMPGPGFLHVISVVEVRDRLAALPDWMLEPLEVVQLSRMTRKKKTFPMYGMQWGPSLYLYPIDDSLIEYFARPPKPAQRIETEMYGGRWEQQADDLWLLHWTEKTIRDFYLNNVLIHELGHLLDDRNTGYAERERYAEWFAIEYGYKASRAGRAERPVRKRHHAT